MSGDPVLGNGERSPLLRQASSSDLRMLSGTTRPTTSHEVRRGVEHVCESLALKSYDSERKQRRREYPASAITPPTAIMIADRIKPASRGP